MQGRKNTKVEYLIYSFCYYQHFYMFDKDTNVIHMVNTN